MEFNNKINEIYSKIDYWWNLDKTKRAVSIFRENFAMTKKNGLTKYWMPEFKNHLSSFFKLKNIKVVKIEDSFYSVKVLVQVIK